MSETVEVLRQVRRMAEGLHAQYRERRDRHGVGAEDWVRWHERASGVTPLISQLDAEIADLVPPDAEDGWGAYPADARALWEKMKPFRRTS